MQKTVDILKNDGVILHLTDTTWGLAASCLSKPAIDKVYNIKNRPSQKSLILLVSSITMLKQYVHITHDIMQYIMSTRPTTIIYDSIINIPEHLLATDGSIAIRVVQKKELADMIDLLGHPLVSTSANISGEKSPIFYKDIHTNIINKVDYIEKGEVTLVTPPSRIISFKNNAITVIRE